MASENKKAFKENIPGTVNDLPEEQTMSLKRSAPSDVDDSPDTADSQHPAKEAKINIPSSMPSNDEILDIAATLGYKAGDRFEVQWEIQNEGDDGEEGGNLGFTDQKQGDSETRWWGATLLGFDGRTVDSVAIRVLDYDPYPEGGFPERSREDVIFLGDETLVDPESQNELRYRPAGENESSISLGREQIEEFVNATLQNAMKKSEQAWNALPASKQAEIADHVAKKKEKLLELLLGRNGIITASEMKAILAQAIADED